MDTESNVENGTSLQYVLDHFEKNLIEKIQQLLTKSQGDVIQSGGVKNISINYYGSKSRTAYDAYPDELPARLTTPQAQHIKETLIGAQLITDHWQPIDLSGSERSLLAKAVCDRLAITDVWQVFSQVWSEQPATLRAYFNRALEQKKSLCFQEKLRNLLG